MVLKFGVTENNACFAAYVSFWFGRSIDQFVGKFMAQ